MLTSYVEILIHWAAPQERSLYFKHIITQGLNDGLLINVMIHLFDFVLIFKLLVIMQSFI